jgi:hypothetical protein
MTLLERLDPPLPIMTADGQKGYCHAWLDYGPDYDTLWLVALDESREFWWLRQSLVRAVDNISLGRDRHAEPGKLCRDAGGTPSRR